jgi:hypothetical protein
MTGSGALDQPDQSGDPEEFTDDEAAVDDLVDDASITVTEPPVTETAAFEPPPSVFGQPSSLSEPPPAAPEEHVGVADTEADAAPASPEVSSPPEPIATPDPSDPLTREQP